MLQCTRIHTTKSIAIVSLSYKNSYWALCVVCVKDQSMKQENIKENYAKEYNVKEQTSDATLCEGVCCDGAICNGAMSVNSIQ